MSKSIFRAALLGATIFIPALAASAELAADHSNSASAVGDPFAYGMAVTRGDGGSPLDSGNSAAVTGDAMAFSGSVTQQAAGTPNLNWSESASALGGPGTGPRQTQPASRLVATQR